MATRRRVLSPYGLGPRHNTLIAPTSAELRGLLADQSRADAGR
jgi:hypothetical protein